MNAERDYLVKVVFPALREQLEPHRVLLRDIDLRWGVPKEQSRNDQVIKLCLDQVDECRPFFVGILGERYGLIQPNTGKSLVELEIIHCLESNPSKQRCALFYFRDPEVVKSIPLKLRERNYVETDPKRINQLTSLKEYIRRSECQVMSPYPARWDSQAFDSLNNTHGRISGLEAFGTAVTNQLFDAIKTELDLPETPLADDTPDEQREYEAHKRFIESRLRVYVGREKLNRRLADRLSADDRTPLLVTGASGSGKSAVLARLYTDSAPSFNLALAHFIGASPESASLVQLMRRCCLAIHEAFPDPDRQDFDPPHQFNLLRRFFHDLLARIPPDKSALFVVDALDQLDEQKRRHELDWLPATLPPNVKFVVSYTSDSPFIAQARERSWRIIKVGPLTVKERLGILSEVPLLSAKALDQHQIDLLLKNRATANPLFLLVALEELRGFGSFDQLSERIAALPSEGDTVSAIFAQVIERLENDFDKEVVATLLQLLASARFGLSDNEMSELLSGASQLFPALRQLRSYLINRSGLYDFYHRQLRNAVKTRYLNTESASRAAHRRLARHWLDTQAKGPVANRRKTGELPWQQSRGGLWRDLEITLGEVDFLDAKNRAYGPWALVDDFEQLIGAEDAGLIELRDRDALIALNNTIQLSARTLALDPAQFAGQLGGRLLGESSTLLRSLVDTAAGKQTSVWLQPLSASLTPPRQPLLQTLFEGSTPVRALAVIAESEKLVLACGNNLTVLDLSNGEELQTFTGEHVLSAVVLLDDQGIVAAGDRDGQITIWNVNTGQLLRTMKNRSKVNGLVVTADHELLVSCHPNGCDIWRWRSGELLRSIEAEVINCAILPLNEQGLITGSIDGRIDVWDLVTGEEIGPIGCHGHFKNSRLTELAMGIQQGLSSMFMVSPAGLSQFDKLVDPRADAINAFSLSPDGKSLASASNDQSVRVWNLQKLDESLALNGHTAPVRAVLITPQHIISGADDGLIKFWNRETGEQVSTFTGHDSAITSLATYASGTRLVSASRDGTVRIWNTENSRIAQTPNEGIPVSFITLSPDERHAYSFTRGTELKIWDLENLAQTDLQICPEDSGQPLAVSHDRQRVIATPRSNELRIWDLETAATLMRAAGWWDLSEYRGFGEKECKVNEDSDWGITAAVLTADERYLISANSWRSPTPYTEDDTDRVDRQSPIGGDASVIKIWDVLSGAMRSIVSRSLGYVDALAITPDGNILVSVSAGEIVREGNTVKFPEPGDEIVTLWSLPDSVQIASFRGQAPVFVSDDSEWLISTTPKYEIQLTSLKNPQATPRVMAGHTAPVKSLAILKGTMLAVSAAEDSTVRLWDLSEERLLAVFTGDCAFTRCVLRADGLIVAGDAYGRMHFLRISNLDLGHMEQVRKRSLQTPLPDLFHLARAKDTHLWVRFDAARELERLGRTAEASQVWKHISQLQECSSQLRDYATQQIKGTISTTESAQLDLSLALDITQNEEARNRAIQALIDAGRTPELLKVVSTITDASFTNYFKSPGINVAIRAAYGAAMLGGDDELLQIASSGWVEGVLCIVAAEVVGRFGKFDEAIASLSEVAREQTFDPKTRLLAIQSEHNLGAVSEAIAQMEELASDELIVDEYRERAVEAICRFGAIAAQVFSSPACDAHIPYDLGIAGGGVDFRAQGLEYLDREEYEKAIASFDAALQDNATDAWIHFYRGEANLGLQKYEEAVEDFSRTISIDWTIEQAFMRRAAAYKLLGDEYSAYDDYRSAHALNPSGQGSLAGGHLWMLLDTFAREKLYRPSRQIDPTRLHSSSNSNEYTEEEATAQAVVSLHRLGFVDIIAEHLAALAADESVPANLRRDAITGLEKLDRRYLMHD